MEVKDFLEKVAGVEGGDQLVEFFNSHTHGLREEAKGYREDKGKEKLKATEFETALSKILNTTKAGDAEEALKKIAESNSKIEEITNKFNTLSGDIEKEKQEKKAALLENSVIEAIAKAKYSDPHGITKDAMLRRAKEDADSGKHMIKGQSFDEFLQSLSDSKEPEFKEKKEKEKPAGKGGLYSLEELESLTQDEYNKNKEKVELSQKKLSEG